MKIGQHVKLPDGRVATVVFNGLCGTGIKFGWHEPNPKDFEDTYGDLFVAEPKLQPWPWEPEAFLREKEAEKVLGRPCVGEEFTYLD